MTLYTGNPVLELFKHESINSSQNLWLRFVQNNRCRQCFCGVVVELHTRCCICVCVELKCYSGASRSNRGGNELGGGGGFFPIGATMPM